MKAQASTLLRRSIHVHSAPSVTIPSSVGIDVIKPNAHTIKSSPKDDLEQPLFQALGNPPTIVNVTLTPSLPVYIQKGTLLSIYGTSINNISSSITWLNPIKRILLGFHTFKYQKLESTKIATALINSTRRRRRSNNQSSVSTLTLNGSVDWALLPNDSLLAYSGSSLRISTELIPKFIKQDSWFKFGNNKTGLYVPWKSGYTLVSGRGDVVLKGEGSIYKIDLDNEEEVLIRRDNIIGISVNGDELSRCVSEHKGFNNSNSNSNLIDSKEEINKNEAAEIVIEEINQEKTSSNEQNKQLEQFKQYLNQFKEYFIYGIKWISSSLPKIDDNYVNIKGPRTILLQSNLKNPNLLDFNKTSTIEVVESKLQKSAIETTSPEDYLSYAIVKDGKVTFQNTPDFKESVDKLESTNKEK